MAEFAGCTGSWQPRGDGGDCIVEMFRQSEVRCFRSGTYSELGQVLDNSRLFGFIFTTEQTKPSLSVDDITKTLQTATIQNKVDAQIKIK